MVVTPASELRRARTLSPAQLTVLQNMTLPYVSTQPPEFQDFYLLGDQWDLTQVSRRAIGPTSDDTRKFLGPNDRALITALSWQRLHAPHLHAITLTEMPGSQIGVATSKGPLTEPASLFAQCARDVAHQLAGLMPLARALI